MKRENKNILKWVNFYEKLTKNMDENHISEYAAQCSYYTILSFIPFAILLITLIQYTNVDQQTLFDVISKLIPSSMSGFVLDIVREVYSKSIGTISISIIFTIWSAGKGLYALMKGLHEVYEINDKKTNSYIYLKLISVLKTIMFVILIALGLVLLVFGNSLVDIIKVHFGGFENYTVVSSIVTEISFILGTFIIFLLMFCFMPKHRVSFKSQMPGAIFGAITLNIISFIFSRYLDIFKGFSITYGSLTTLMLIMMWIYSCFYTVFLGAELNKTIKQKDNFDT